MTGRKLKLLPLGLFGALSLWLISLNEAPAQEPIPLFPPGQPGFAPQFGPRVQPFIPVGGARFGREVDPEPLPLPLPGRPMQPVQPAQAEEIEVLAKGPIHEAFATTAEAPTATPVIAKQPPEAIEELPPDQKPEGDNVQWIPGYWHWDEENSQFIWVSGFWRQPPPGRVWVPGSWREVRGGWQWVPGFWHELAVQPQQPQPQIQPEIEYLPVPPASLEIGPTVVAPSNTSFYIPGSWVWRGRYVWRPGVWVEHRANWLWVPARYHWTPAGYVFIDGYWDHPLATRGVLFAPVIIPRPLFARPAFVYTPVYVVSEPCLVGALFVRRGYSHYYFGDYFDNRYVDRGFNAWCGTVGRNGFSIGFGAGRTWGYDPLWSYYTVSFRNTPRWQTGVNDLYTGRYRGDIVRPPTTLVQQNTVINNITKTNVTNVTNNITVVNGAPTVGNRDVSNVAMVTPLKIVPSLNNTKFEAVNAERRREEAAAAKQIRDVAVQRTKLETAVVNQPKPIVKPGMPQPVVQPQTIKLEVSKVAAQRAQISNDEKKAPPPNPLRAGGNTPKVDPKVDPKSPINPKVDPKLPINPKVDPTPKVDPKLPINPKVDPKIEPKLPINPKVDPKVDPKLPVNPKVDPTPKVDPKLPINPKVDPKLPVNPKVEPLPKIDPKQPVNPLPKIDPKPKIDPPVNPLPKVDPKVNPKIDPLPKVDPKQPVNPLPKVDPPKPKFDPPVNPLPKIEPKQPVNPLPKIDPKPKFDPPVNPLPKVDPPKQPAPKFDPPPVPKVDTTPKFNPPPQPAPKIDPKPVVNPPKFDPPPQPAPKVNPPSTPAPKVNPPSTPAPKVNPPATPSTPAPKVNPPATPAPKVNSPSTPAPKGNNNPRPKSKG